jgi:hypothetical protein
VRGHTASGRATTKRSISEKHGFCQEKTPAIAVLTPVKKFSRKRSVCPRFSNVERLYEKLDHQRGGFGAVTNGVAA